MSRRPAKTSAPKNGPLLPASGWPGGPRIKSPEERKEQAARNRRGSITAQEGWSLLMLLVLPAWALCRVAAVIAPWLIVAGVAGISILTWLAMALDKKRAVTGQWRTPESTLHLLELLGGWPASFAAQRIHRHKIIKSSYQFVYWCLVALHQAVAADFLLGWKSVGLLRGWLGG
jgi:uncharacterized membrane protein YsdA (DUF1294 family)